MLSKMSAAIILSPPAFALAKQMQDCQDRLEIREVLQTHLAREIVLEPGR